MKTKFLNVLIQLGKIVAPLAMAMAIFTANSTCYFFSYQPDTPKSLDKYRRG